jgi:hypothetical protein
MMMDVTGDGLDDLVVPTVPWNAAAHSEFPTTDWTLTPNLFEVTERHRRSAQHPSG